MSLNAKCGRYKVQPFKLFIAVKDVFKTLLCQSVVAGRSLAVRIHSFIQPSLSEFRRSSANVCVWGMDNIVGGFVNSGDGTCA